MQEKYAGGFGRPRERRERVAGILQHPSCVNEKISGSPGPSRGAILDSVPYFLMTWFINHVGNFTLGLRHRDKKGHLAYHLSVKCKIWLSKLSKVDPDG